MTISPHSKCCNPTRTILRWHVAISSLILLGLYGKGVSCWDILAYQRQCPKVSSLLQNQRGRFLLSLHASGSTGFEGDEETALQWALLRDYHARGSWKGIWTTYDYLGDVIDETIASVNLQFVEDKHNGDNSPVPRIEHSHTIVVGAKRSDCATCFDSFDCKTIPVAVYTPGQMGRCRSAFFSMVNGPSVLRSGAMATELILSHRDGRVRVIVYHAPVWQKSREGEKRIDEKVGPPDGLKIYRVMISKEALRPTPPTAESEAMLSDDSSLSSDNEQAQPRFYRPVPPFAWHKSWGGISWTWGPSKGNGGWRIDEMEEADAWHGRPTGDSPNVWSLRLNSGGILVQAPRVIVSGEAGLFRLAWLPFDHTLLRAEAGILALDPIIDDDDEDSDVVGFHPPSLVSLRCDSMNKTGDLEGKPRFVEPNENESEKVGSDDMPINSIELNSAPSQPGRPAENASMSVTRGDVQSILDSLNF